MFTIFFLIFPCFFLSAQIDVNFFISLYYTSIKGRFFHVSGKKFFYTSIKNNFPSDAEIVLCSYYFTFRLWENWYELWVENFLRFTRETKIGLEKPILKFRVPAGHEKFQRLREANFCLPREPEKTFHEQFISVWAHPKGKIIRTDCFISFFGYLRVYDQ